VNRWVYLNAVVYRVRHAIAAHFMTGLHQVVEVGVFREPSPIAGVIGVDPLGVTPGAFHGSIAEWVACHDWRPEGVVALGLDLNGEPEEMDALVDLVANARVSVLETAVKHGIGMAQLNRLAEGRELVADIHLTLPKVDAEGFPVYGERRLVVVGQR
jgi:hypothetical protein